MADVKIRVPARRAPRLPRDHWAMRPQMTRLQRGMRNGVLISAVVAGAAWLLCR